jgi:hypothetical protein
MSILVCAAMGLATPFLPAISGVTLSEGDVAAYEQCVAQDSDLAVIHERVCYWKQAYSVDDIQAAFKPIGSLFR